MYYHCVCKHILYGCGHVSHSMYVKVRGQLCGTLSTLHRLQGLNSSQQVCTENSLAPKVTLELLNFGVVHCTEIGK